MMKGGKRSIGGKRGINWAYLQKKKVFVNKKWQVLVNEGFYGNSLGDSGTFIAFFRSGGARHLTRLPSTSLPTVRTPRPCKG